MSPDRVEGTTAAVEAGQAWAVSYDIRLAPGWLPQRARVTARAGSRTLESDGAGRRRIDAAPALQVDGCLDVDLESSALTNALPVHRLAVEVGRQAEAPAAYVRALDLGVERL